MNENDKTETETVTETTTSGVPQPNNPIGEATDPAAVAQNAVANANPVTEKVTITERPVSESPEAQESAES